MGTYVAHGKDTNDAKIRGKKVIQVILIQVLEQDIQPNEHHTPANREHPSIVRRDHIDRWLIVFIRGTIFAPFLDSLRFQRC